MTRTRATLLAVGAVLVVVVAVGLLVFQPWLLVVDDTVDEADEVGQVVGTASGGLSQTAFPTPASPSTSAPADPQRVELAAADFIDAEHETSGRAILYLRDDGSR